MYDHVDSSNHDHTPNPREQLPKEPPDHSGWFQVYLTLPSQPYLVRIVQNVGMNPRSSWTSTVALLPAGKFERAHLGAASENTYFRSRRACRLRKDTK